MIPTLAALVAHSLRRSRWLLAATFTLLALFQGLTSFMAATFQEMGYFERLAALVPDFIRQIFGSSFLPMLSFTGIVLLGYFHFAIIVFLVGLSIAMATEPASDVEHRFTDLLLARPVPRWLSILRSAVVVAVVAAGVTLSMAAGTWGGLALFAPPGARWPRPGVVLSLSLSLASLLACWGGIALAAGAAARRRAVAGGGTGVAAFALFLLDLVARVRDPVGGGARLSPFHYFSPLLAITGARVPWADISALLAFGAAGLAVALVVYTRRDLA
jgi:ABC-2 type transport system permease protein